MTIPGYDYYRDRVPGLERTTGGLGGDIPQQTITGHTAKFYKRLYKSPRDIALITDKTIRGGYGVLELGTVLAVDQNDTDKLVPYTPDTISTTDVSRVFLQTDLDNATTFRVDLYESYKLAADDYIILTDSDGTYETVQIDSIDVSTYESLGQALITLTGACSGTYTIAKNANCYVKAEDAVTSNKCSKAAYILDSEVDTGAGEYAKGGIAPVLISNAIIYQSDVPNMDADAITDLGNVSSDGIYYILK